MPSPPLPLTVHVPAPGAAAIAQPRLLTPTQLLKDAKAAATRSSSQVSCRAYSGNANSGNSMHEQTAAVLSALQSACTCQHDIFLQPPVPHQGS